jgi:transcriptional regulator with XRE-family HTH domain
MNNVIETQGEYIMDIKPSPFEVPEWTVGDRIRKAREFRGLSRQDVVDKDFTQEFTVRIIGNYEAGITKPRPSALKALANLIQISYEWLESGKAPTGPEGPDGGVPNNVVRLPGLDSNQEPIG